MSTALCLCLIFGLTPGAAMGAENEPGEPPAPSVDEARYKTEENGDWVYGSLAYACEGTYVGGRVELLRDIEQPAPVTIIKNMTIASIDPGAPCKITYITEKREGDYLLTIKANVTLENIILDGGREKNLTTHTELVGVKSGTLTMENGAVIQNNDNVDTAKGAGGLRVIGGTAVMQAGSVIRKCRAVAGGGAAVAGNGAKLVLNGGTIEDCEAIIGGGVFVQDNYSQNKGKLFLYDSASICRNHAKEYVEGIDSHVVNDWLRGNGGGIFVEGGYTYMLGGNTGAALSENIAENSGGGIFFNEGVLQLANGSVTRNYAQIYGGGVLTNPGVNVLVGNGPCVTDNISGNGYDNLYLDGGEADGTDFTLPMLIGAFLWENASIGVSRWVSPDKDNPYRVVAVPANRHIITESDLSKFHSDDPSYVTLLKDGNIVLTSADVVFDTKGHGETPPGQQIDDAHNHKVVEPEEPKELGYDFGGWYEDKECSEGKEWNFETMITVADDDLRPIKILYAKWTPTPYNISYELEEGQNAESNPDEYNIESEEITLQAPTKEGYTFLGWTWDGQDTPQANVTIPQGSTDDKSFTANWAKEEPPPEPPVPPVWDPVYYTITASAGEGGSIEPEGRISVPLGGSRSFSVTPDEGWEIADVLVDDKSVGAVTGYSFETVTSSHTIEARFRRAGGFGYADCPRDHTCPIWPYTDASTTDWYHDGVHFCIENGLMVGYGNKIFAPCDCLSRGMLAQIIYNREGRPDPPEGCPFEDVEPGAWYAKAVAWAAEQGVVEGYGNGKFGPEDPVTREQLAAMLWRYAGRPESGAELEGFSDGNMTSPWAVSALRWAVEQGIVEGRGDGILDPAGYASRAEAAAMIQRFCRIMLYRITNAVV